MNEKKPLVSILIPVFNREIMLEACIQSALKQTFTDVEIIVVDNASTDGTWQVCEKYAAIDSRVHIFRNKENIGPVRNWKKCADLARGKYSKILFSDDLIHPQYLEKTLPIINDETVAFVFSNVCIGSAEWKGNVYYRYQCENAKIPTKKYLNDIIFMGNLPVSPGCALFRTKDIRNNIYLTIPSPTISDFEKHGAGPDLLLFLLTATAYTNIAYIDETLAFFRHHPGSETIKDKKGYLAKCYFQIKVWYSENYMNKDTAGILLIFGWLRTIQKIKELIFFPRFASLYSYKNRNNLFLLFYQSLILGAQIIYRRSKLVNKI